MILKFPKETQINILTTHIHLLLQPTPVIQQIVCKILRILTHLNIPQLPTKFLLLRILIHLNPLPTIRLSIQINHLELSLSDQITRFLSTLSKFQRLQIQPTLNEGPIEALLLHL